MSKKNKKFKRQIRAEILAELQRQESKAKTEKIASPAFRERQDRNDTVVASAATKIHEVKIESRGELTVKKDLLKILITFGFLILVLITLTIINQKNQFLDRGVEQIFSRF